MLRSIFAIAVLTGLLLTSIADAQRRSSCGPSGCGNSSFSASGSSCGPDGCRSDDSPAVPVQAPAVKYQWKQDASNPDDWHLYRNNVQIGGWRVSSQKYRTLIDWDRGLWSAPQNDAIDPLSGKHVVIPQELLASAGKTGQLEAWQTKGVNEGEMCKHERYSINGQNVAFADAMNAIGKGVLPDDAAKLYLSIWSKDPAVRKKVVDDLKANAEIWKWVQERCHLWAGDAAHPDHFLTKDRDGQPLYAIDGEPTISLQAPDGVELWHDKGYTQGPSSFDAIRKRDPKYSPDKTPGPKTPTPSPSGGSDSDMLLYAGLAAAALFVLFNRRKD